MRDKLFTLTRSQREDLWRRYKQTSDRREAERLHAILLPDEGRSAHEVSTILHLHPKTLKRWIKRGTRIELKTNSGLQRLNVLGAYSPDDQTLEALEGTESCDAELVCRLLRKLRTANPGKRLLVVLDNARYQRARCVQALARRLRIHLLFLPPYSLNLNLIERFWKFLRKQVLRNTYYATFAEFRAAIQRLLTNLSEYTDELSTLKTEHFQLFKAIA